MPLFNSTVTHLTKGQYKLFSTFFCFGTATYVTLFIEKSIKIKVSLFSEFVNKLMQLVSV